MRRDYLLRTNGIQVRDVNRITESEDGGWIIDLRAAKQGFCPVCGSRSRRRKASGIHVLQGIGTDGIPLRVHVHWTDFYCREPGCPRSTFREIRGKQYRGSGKLVSSDIGKMWRKDRASGEGERRVSETSPEGADRPVRR